MPWPIGQWCGHPFPTPELPPLPSNPAPAATARATFPAPVASEPDTSAVVPQPHPFATAPAVAPSLSCPTATPNSDLFTNQLNHRQCYPTPMRVSPWLQFRSGTSRPRTGPTHGPEGRYSPRHKTFDVPHLLNEERVRRQLEGSVRWGCKPKARQIRLSVLWLRLQRRAMDRVLQWVASLAVVSSARVIASSTSSSVIAQARPLRGSSDRPSSLRSRNLERHFPTISSDTPRSAATAVLLPPSAQANIILARSTTACAVFGRRLTAAAFPAPRNPKLAGSLVVQWPWPSPSGRLTRRMTQHPPFHYLLQLHHTSTGSNQHYR